MAVITYRRPGPLAGLLPELVRQAGVQEGRRVRVVVVDNDDAGGAAATVRDLGLDAVTYVHEPRPGISAARNAAIREAADADTLVFIDDDETPEPSWLSALLAAHEQLGGAAITGPVLRRHEREPAKWVRAARVMDRRRHPTGTVVDAAGTGNILLDLVHVRRHGLAFDDALGLTGGSDHLFTKEICRTGGEIYWCDEAVVHEFVPADRLTGRWTLRRGYRSGNTGVSVELLLADTPLARARVRATNLAGGMARVALGAGRVLAGLATGNADRVGRGAWTLARGCGRFGGAFGHRFSEYRRPKSERTPPT